MFHEGEFVADYVTKPNGDPVNEEQVQAHGVELTIDNIFSVDGKAELTDDEYNKPNREMIQPVEVGDYATQIIRPGDKAHHLYPGIHGNYFVVQYNELIEIPDKCVGFVWPRSRFLRCGMHLTSAVWESGYKGRGEGALYLGTETYLADNMSVGQMLMCRASVLNQYDGSHQNERLEAYSDS